MCNHTLMWWSSIPFYQPNITQIPVWQGGNGCAGLCSICGRLLDAGGFLEENSSCYNRPLWICGITGAITDANLHWYCITGATPHWSMQMDQTWEGHWDLIHTGASSHQTWAWSTIPSPATPFSHHPIPPISSHPFTPALNIPTATVLLLYFCAPCQNVYFLGTGPWQDWTVNLGPTFTFNVESTGTVT